MKKLVLALLVLTFSLTGCNSEQPTDLLQEQVKVEAPEQHETDKQEQTKYSITLGEGEITKTQYEEGDVLMIDYTFTNNSNEPIGSDMAVLFYAYQDGIEIDRTFDTSISNDNDSKKVQPGSSIDCKAIFKLVNINSPVQIDVQEFTGDSITNKEYILE